MNSGHCAFHARRAAALFTATLLFATITGTVAHASVLTALVIDPPTTAGAGSNSTRSGAGTWHLFAVDNTNDNFGISSFDVTVQSLGGAMTASNRAPATNYDDGNGDAFPAGFNLLRQTIGNNTATVEFTGSQQLPPSINSSSDVGVDYFPISGFGQTASSFATKYPNTILGPTTGSSWGNYSDPISFGFPTNGNKFVMLGEGTYTGAAPFIARASYTIYTNFSTTFQSAFADTTPEPATLAYFGVAAAAGLLRRKRA